MIFDLKTIILYFGVFLFAILLTFFADKSNSAYQKKFFLLMVVLILTLFGGLRSFSVGTDTESLIEYYFSTNINTLFAEGVSKGAIYPLIVVLLRRINLGAKSFLVILEFFYVVTVVICAWKRRNTSSMSLTLMIFLFLYYQLGFNWERQSISCAVFLLGIIYVTQNYRAKGIVLFVVSFMFHPSATLGMASCYVAYRLMKLNKKSYKSWLITIFLFLGLIVASNWYQLSLGLISMGILPHQYIDYVNLFSGNYYNARYANWFGIGQRMYVEYAMRIVFVVLPIIYHSKQSQIDAEYEKEFELYKYLSLISLCLYSFGVLFLKTAYINRVTYYLDFANIIYLTFIIKPIGMVMETNRRTHGLVIEKRSVLIFGAALFYNIWLYYVLGWHGTVPFN